MGHTNKGTLLLDGSRIIEESLSKSYVCNRCIFFYDDLIGISLSYSTCISTILLIDFVQEIFTADDPYQDVPDILVSQVIAGENRRPDRPDDVDDNLWSLWGEGWNQDAALRPGMESYVERLTQLA